MSLYPPPRSIHTAIWSSMPQEFRHVGARPAWGQANRPGDIVDSFIEGPAFDRDGNLWVTDIPFGRLFRIDRAGSWSLACDYDGWPNGLAIHADGRIFIADYKHGILVHEPGSSSVETFLGDRYSEHFRGCNDLIFDSRGRLYFTDQGQSGMHMPNGRVYRYDLESGRLDCLIDNAPSPNGLVLSKDESSLLVAMTRANCVWRVPLMADGGVSKVGVFVQLSGGMGGPDGLALGEDGGLFVAHVGNGCAWGFDPLGAPRVRLLSDVGLAVTNMAFDPFDPQQMVITESSGGHILKVDAQGRGNPLPSHV